jgi:hypothetical protein
MGTALRLLALILVFGAPALAQDDEATARELEELREKLEALKERQDAVLDKEVDDYLEETEDEERRARSAGSVWDRITIRGRLTAVSQNTVGLSPGNASVINGDADLDFDFEVTGNLRVFVHLTGNAQQESDDFGGFNDGPGLPPQFPHVTSSVQADGLFLGATLSGLTDGIGVDGTRGVKPGLLALYEAGIEHAAQVGGSVLHWSIGALDPRRRFLQNAFADDENTQFLNNVFDDSPAVRWLSDSSGRSYLGVHMWVATGSREEYEVSWGWFNEPGEFWNDGQFYAQFGWRGDVSGRPMNLRFMGFVDAHHRNASNDRDYGGGISWDWEASDTVGLFVRGALAAADVNPVEYDVELGLIIQSFSTRRPDDTIGAAFGVISINDVVVDSITTDHKERELVLELYYRLVLEEGALQVTPFVMFVADPGAGLTPWQDNSLSLVGLRVFAQF